MSSKLESKRSERMTREMQRIETMENERYKDAMKIEGMAKIKKGGQAYNIIQNSGMYANTMEG